MSCCLRSGPFPSVDMNRSSDIVLFLLKKSVSRLSSVGAVVEGESVDVAQGE